MAIKVFSGLVLLALSFGVGVWYGYEKGVQNHIVYDTPARVALYDAAIKSNDPKKVLKALAENQIKMMNSLESYSNAMLLNLPVHQGVEEIYLKYLPVTEAYNQAVKGTY